MKRILIAVFLYLLATPGWSRAQQPMELQPADWKAKWISLPVIKDTLDYPCPIYVKTFSTNRKIKSATLYATAHGIYEIEINNKKVGDDYFRPGWTSYNERLQYQAYDVTKMLTRENTIHATVSHGWYRLKAWYRPHIDNGWYGIDPAFLMQLQITYTDGTQELIVTDKSWAVTSGPIIKAGIYRGEWVDRRITPGKGIPVKEMDFPLTNLVPTVGPPVARQEEFKPVHILRGNVIDFGQNMAGWVRIRVRGRAGDTITIRHGEFANDDGSLFIGSVGEKTAIDRYILKGEGEEVLEPRFTYHGFRFAEVKGCDVTPENVTAIAVYSKLDHTGEFTCSDPMLNRLQQNIVWGMNSNYFDIPTDCPQRGERYGWAGDAQVFCRTAAFNKDIKSFYSKWLLDLLAEQLDNGISQGVIPSLLHNKDTASYNTEWAGWGDAATVVPWTMYEVYGDRSLLERQYESMKKWVHYIESKSPDYLWKEDGGGDWCYPRIDTPTPIAVVNQCYYAYATQLVLNAARVMNNTADLTYYTALLKKVKDAFMQEYGTKMPATQTAYILA